MFSREELVKYVESTISDLVSGRLDQFHYDADGTAPYVAKKAVDNEFKTDFLSRIFYEPRYIYGVIAKQVIECKVEPAMDNGVPLLDIETCNLEFSIIRLYYLKMLETKKEPFPPDYTLFQFRFLSCLAFYPQMSLQVQRIVPEHIWLDFYPFLCQKQDCILQCNYNENNSFNYMIDHISTLALRHAMGKFCPVPLTQ
jgi:hypothetical protein